MPKQNNSLKSTNRSVKDDDTMRERLSIGKFFDVVEYETVLMWGHRTNPGNLNFKPYANNVTISLATWTSAWQWCQEQKPLFSLFFRNLIIS